MGKRGELASYAVPDRYEENEERSVFQKDIDKITFSKAYKRLDEKTQVFIAGSGDHYMNRLTHSERVARLSRGLARRLGANEDLAEAIALAHDLGHPPFGHAGENALDEVVKEFDEGMGFEHNLQSVRVVTQLERAYPNMKGLNLSDEVIEGLMKHQSVYDQAGVEFDGAPTLEAQIVNLADEIAYTAHDIDDAIRSGIISIDDFRANDIALWNDSEQAVYNEYGQNIDDDLLITRVVSEITSRLVNSVCEQTRENIRKQEIVTLGNVRAANKPIVEFGKNESNDLPQTRKYLFDNFYESDEIKKNVDAGKLMIKALFRHYVDTPDDMGDAYDEADSPNKTELLQLVLDYVSGMTDSFLIKKHDEFIIHEN